MARYFGTVGFVSTKETKPGVWTEVKDERKYSGDLLSNSRRWETRSESTNDNLNVNNKISILADDFARQNLSAIKYVELMGALWKVSDISIEYPRLVLSVGGLYNAGPD